MLFVVCLSVLLLLIGVVIVCCRLFVVCCRLLVVGCWLFVVCWFLLDEKRLVVVFYFHLYKQRQSLFPCGDSVHVLIVCVCVCVCVCVHVGCLVLLFHR